MSHLVQYRQGFLKETDIEHGECSSQEGLLFEQALILLSLLPRVSSAGKKKTKYIAKGQNMTTFHIAIKCCNQDKLYF